MQIIFSPSKEMNFQEGSFPITTKPSFVEKTKEVVETLKGIDNLHLAKISKFKDKKLEELRLNIENFEDLAEKPAIGAYSGISFRQLGIDGYKEEEWLYIKENVNILSALYGISKGTDLIRYHRLDMTMKIMDINPYAFWKDSFDTTQLLPKGEVIVDLASKEFSKLLIKSGYELLSFEFLEMKNGNYKSISTNSKKARGKVLNFLIKNQIKDIEDIKAWAEDGYKFSIERSNEKNFVFLKDDH